jgi:predicted TPR repeat methyltransferase
MGAILRLALLGAVAQQPGLPGAYVAAVFDGYAPRFEASLLQALDYRVPAELADLVAATPGAAGGCGRVLDLGCGTGLAGERLRARAAWLEGVDLSARMVEVARRKALYDELAVEDACAFLALRPRRYDLIVAADVLVYFGDLAGILACVGAALADGGRFAFSVEAADGDGFRLTPGQRYAHSEGYLRGSLAAAGFDLLELRARACRLEGGRPVPGLLAVAAPGRSVAVPAGEAAMECLPDVRAAH